ncbi:MAG: hypothetical protein HKP29_09625 [Silicimonas sp.]|nr:hypothetical protein [Silicimonas sp.]
MSRPNPYILTGLLLVFIAVFGGLTVLQDGLYLDTHEADTYHHLDILFRMEDGAYPHRDFVSPIGVLAFLPVVFLMKSGLSAGMAFLWAQVAVALILWPAVSYGAATRLSRGPAYAFGLLVLGLVLALTYGGADAGVSISMHYNRWAWAVSFAMLTLAILPPLGRPAPVLDGVLIGALAAALLLLKITFFAGLVPLAALALLWRGQRTAAVAGLVTGLAVILVATALLGPGHWLAYLNDLRAVATSEVRPSAGVPFDQIVAGPAYIAGTIVTILAVLLLRNAGRSREGIFLLLLFPAFIYITYQNFGNDPKWLAFVALMLIALRPAPGLHAVAGIDLSDAARWLAVAALALVLPSLANLAMSPLKHAAIQSARFLPMVPSRDGDQQIFVRVDRANTMTAQVHLDADTGVWAKYAEDAGRAPPLTIENITFPECELLAGSRAFHVEIAAALEAAGVAPGSQIFTADILTAFWLFGPFEPLKNGAPWYYGDLSGLENADYVLVPKCSFLSSLRRTIVDDLKEAAVPLSLVRDDELFALFAIRR